MPIVRTGHRILLMGLLGLIVLLCSSETVFGYNSFRTKPTTNHGNKWRIGYYEGGPYINYPANLKTIAHGLAKLGWMETFREKKLEDSTDSKSVWLNLCKTKSDYLQFVPEAYSSADWDDELRAWNQAAVIGGLQNHELDFMIAMGTWAGQDLANNRHSVPIMVVSASNPIKSGIIASARRSGYDHVHARCDPWRYIRQIRLFHDIFNFKRLGIAYEYTPVGKTYAALTDIEYVAARRGFKLVACDAPWSGISETKRTERLIECHNTLAPQIDALFITVHAGMDTKRMDEFLSRLIAKKIPTWSQRGPQEVQHGVLMSIARGDFDAVGLYHAVIMARIFNGANPGSLSQIFEDPKNIAINLKTAQAIDFDPPKGLLKVADKIYK